MIALQIITVFFAIACAWLNKWPVKLMRAYWAEGSHKKQEKEFHAANAVVKVLWAALGAIMFHVEGVVPTSAAILIVLLIQWLVFDIALNLFTGKHAFYLGQTAWLDKTVKNGKVKALVVLAIIIALNFII
jgi:hypothetical protein